ncbi:MAG TPA: hypothetical protein PLU15_03600, partial [Bacillota bacterium]|nr:hypothetical protein [Bacillota bacterium]
RSASKACRLGMTAPDIVNVSEAIIDESFAPDRSRIYSVLSCRGRITCAEKDILAFDSLMHQVHGPG